MARGTTAKGALSKGCNIQEFSVRDTPVGDGLTLHQKKLEDKERRDGGRKRERVVSVCFDWSLVVPVLSKHRTCCFNIVAKQLKQTFVSDST